jgi:hypothetical protein
MKFYVMNVKKTRTIEIKNMIKNYHKSMVKEYWIPKEMFKYDYDSIIFFTFQKN